MNNIKSYKDLIVWQKSIELDLSAEENFSQSFSLIEEVSKIIRTISSNLERKGENSPKLAI